MLELKFSVPDLRTQVLVSDYLDDLQIAADVSNAITLEISEFVNQVAPMLVTSLVVPKT